jgi:inner membrane protease ATP23
MVLGTQVRAASLSGDCSFWNEVQRGNVALQGQHMVCVRRRAALSVSMNENCPSREAADAAVEKVWDKCFQDTSPFDRRP